MTANSQFGDPAVPPMSNDAIDIVWNHATHAAALPPRKREKRRHELRVLLALAERADDDRRVQISKFELAKILNSSSIAVKNRLRALEEAGILKVYREVPRIDLADRRWRKSGMEGGEACYTWTGPRLTELKGINTYRLPGMPYVYEIVDIKQ